MIRLILPFLVVLLCSCTNIKSVDEQFSGYLSDYSGLEPVDVDDGSKVLSWHSPTAKEGNYSKVIVKPIEFYPEPQPSEQVSLDQLEQVSSYMTQQVADALSQEYEVVTEPGPNTFVVRFAITGVETPTQGLQVQNVIPVSLVIAGVSTAVGERDHVVVLYVEGQATDALSGKVLAKGVRQGVGEKLHDDDEQLKTEHLKGLIDGWAQEIATFAGRLKNNG